MRDVNSINTVTNEVLQTYSKNQDNILVLLIGACSRTGKSTLSEKLSNSLNELNQHSLIINLDSWLIDIVKRNYTLTVMERYDTNAIVNSINRLINGKSISPPVYDAQRRKRIAEYSDKPISIDSGIIIVEGLIALAIKELINISKFSIFVEISNCMRVKRLIEFYFSLMGKYSDACVGFTDRAAGLLIPRPLAAG